MKPIVKLPGGYWIEGAAIYQNDEGCVQVARFNGGPVSKENRKAREEFAAAMNRGAKEPAAPVTDACDCYKYERKVCDVCQGVGGKDRAPPGDVAMQAARVAVECALQPVRSDAGFGEAQFIHTAKVQKVAAIIQRAIGSEFQRGYHRGLQSPVVSAEAHTISKLKKALEDIANLENLPDGHGSLSYSMVAHARSALATAEAKAGA